MKTITPIAHLRQTSNENYVEQALTEHLSNVSAIAGILSQKLNLSKAGELIGLLHDLGKFSDEFQNYICSSEGLIDPDEDDYVDAAREKGKR